MANIMITSKCNLHCEYCFANKLVNQSNALDMTLEDFQTAINFALTDNLFGMGIIGGEPTLHHQFKNILDMVIQDSRISRVLLYTNGIELKNYIEQLSNPKFFILFNCNTKPNITEIQYDKMIKNIDEYFKLSPNGSLGINAYSNDLDPTYIFELAQKYLLPTIRVSLSVPNLSYCNTHTYEEYYQEYQPRLKRLAQLSQQYNVGLYFDCDVPPICYLFEDVTVFKNSIHETICRPVIDITPELEATRCFGMSHMTKVKIKDFSDANELRQYFINTIDIPASKIALKPDCYYCAKMDERKCYGGCLRFKTKELINGGTKC